MESIIVETLGPWAWVAFGLLILGIEIAMPSTFLLWPGLAALVVGIITLILGTENSIWPWQAQVIVFLLLSMIIAYFGKRFMKDKNLEESDKPGLNDRGAQMLGRTAVLDKPIKNGSGRIKIGDTTWRVMGEDAKAGETVKVVESDGATLKVEIV